MSSKRKTKREIRNEKSRQKKRTSTIIWSAVGIVAFGLAAYVLWIAVRPAQGKSVPVMSDYGHVEEGADPGPFNSNPPTSGRHYAEEFEAGFYDEDSLEAQYPYPEGYIVHNLEHGYVIFWYNCSTVGENECKRLKDQISSVMDDAGNFKVIAFPSDSIKYPVVMTSWGQMQEFTAFSPSEAIAFVERNRNKAPEPNAP